MNLNINTNDAQAILSGLALTAKTAQGRSAKRHTGVAEIIELGCRLSRQFESQFNYDSGWFECRLCGTAGGIPPMMPAKITKLYGVKSPYLP